VHTLLRRKRKGPSVAVTRGCLARLMGTRVTARSPLRGQVAEVRAVVAMAPAMPHYPSTSRHSIRSRAWGASLQGCSFKVPRTPQAPVAASAAAP
jgi:hypothetical protein